MDNDALKQFVLTIVNTNRNLSYNRDSIAKALSQQFADSNDLELALAGAVKFLKEEKSAYEKAKKVLSDNGFNEFGFPEVKTPPELTAAKPSLLSDRAAYYAHCDKRMARLYYDYVDLPWWKFRQRKRLKEVLLDRLNEWARRVNQQ